MWGRVDAMSDWEIGGLVVEGVAVVLMVALWAVAIYEMRRGSK